MPELGWQQRDRLRSEGGGVGERGHYFGKRFAVCDILVMLFEFILKSASEQPSSQLSAI